VSTRRPVVAAYRASSTERTLPANRYAIPYTYKTDGPVCHSVEGSVGRFAGNEGKNSGEGIEINVALARIELQRTR